MNPRVRVCRHCDTPITDPADAVEVAHEHTNSGPGRTIWAHRAHAHLVRPHPQPLQLLLHIRLHIRLHRAPGTDTPHSATQCPPAASP